MTRCSRMFSHWWDAARTLCADGFEVFPYTTDDLVVGEKLLDARMQGPDALVCADRQAPWGRRTFRALRSMRAHFRDVPLIVDAGLGRPSHAAPGHGTRLRRRSPQHCRRRCKRPCADGRRLCQCHRGRSFLAIKPACSSRATWPSRRPPSSERRCSREARSLLPHC